MCNMSKVENCILKFLLQINSDAFLKDVIQFENAESVFISFQNTFL